MCNFITKFLYSLSVSIILFFSYAQNTFATGTVANLTVQASVVGACSITTPSTLNFGSYVGYQIIASTTLSVKCTSGIPYQILLSQGSNPDSGSSDPSPVRRMISSPSYLPYNLYQDSGCLTVWGNNAASSPAAVNGTGSPQPITVYGKVPAQGSGVAPQIGSYTDTVGITIIYSKS